MGAADVIGRIGHALPVMPGHYRHLNSHSSTSTIVVNDGTAAG